MGFYIKFQLNEKAKTTNDNQGFEAVQNTRSTCFIKSKNRIFKLDKTLLFVF